LVEWRRGRAIGRVPAMTVRRFLPIIVAVLSLAVAGTALAATAGTDSEIIVSPRTTVAKAPDNSPIDFAGASDARRGKPLPSGNVVVGRKVRFTRGDEVAYASLTMRCPSGKSLRTLGLTGDVAPQPMRPLHYVGRRQVDVLVTFNAHRTKVGQSVEGTVLALCR
jgi:hypothetical protein